MGKRMTIEQLEKLKAAGKIKDYTIVGGRNAGKTALSKELTAKRTAKDPGHKNRFKSILEVFCAQYGMVLLCEQRFHPWRKWRVDFVVTGKGRVVFLEYEGLGYGKTGHTESDRYTGNCSKYNAVAMYEIPLLRYTYLNYEEAVVDLKDFFFKLKYSRL